MGFLRKHSHHLLGIHASTFFGAGGGGCGFYHPVEFLKAGSPQKLQVVDLGRDFPGSQVFVFLFLGARAPVTCGTGGRCVEFSEMPNCQKACPQKTGILAYLMNVEGFSETDGSNFENHK